MGQQGAPGVLLKLTREYVDHSAYLLVYSEKYQHSDISTVFSFNQNHGGENAIHQRRMENS